MFLLFRCSGTCPQKKKKDAVQRVMTNINKYSAIINMSQFKLEYIFILVCTKKFT